MLWVRDLNALSNICVKKRPTSLHESDSTVIRYINLWSSFICWKRGQRVWIFLKSLSRSSLYLLQKSIICISSSILFGQASHVLFSIGVTGFVYLLLSMAKRGALILNLAIEPRFSLENISTYASRSKDCLNFTYVLSFLLFSTDLDQ